MPKYRSDAGHCPVAQFDIDLAWCVSMECRLDLYGFKRLVFKTRLPEPCKVPRFGRRSRRGS